jgi:hypothetical protein
MKCISKHYICLQMYTDYSDLQTDAQWYMGRI